MVKEKDAMKREMDRRIVYGGEDFVKDMAKTYNVTERLFGWDNKGAGGTIKRTVHFSPSNFDITFKFVLCFTQPFR